MILMIDNYDSFTYNLVHYLDMLNEEVKVVRNDCISLKEIEDLGPQMIVISPGPCTPNEAGISLEVVNYFKGRIPILGICLGHQTIAQHFGASVVKAPYPVHGKVFAISHDQRGVFSGLTSPIKVTRYHSLTVDPTTLPPDLVVSAQTSDGLIMGLRHKHYAIESLQFHPEAILTEHGLSMLANFLKTYRCSHD